MSGRRCWRGRAAWRRCLAVALLAAAGAPAAAADFSFRGRIGGDDRTVSFRFTTTAAATVTLRTFGYGGGAQANGRAVAAGGFDPILMLFDDAGDLVRAADDSGGNDVTADPLTGNRYDNALAVFLQPGSYTLVLAQFDNFNRSAKLADGFVRQGEGNYTGFEFGPGSGAFYDLDGNRRTGDWALDIGNVQSARGDGVFTDGFE